jgi:hypothetical protein
MKNPAPYLRRTLFSLLDGNVSYESAVVPVYEGEGEVVARQIIIGDYSDADRSNKQNFGANGSQIIEVVCEQPTGIKKHADAIGELVMNLIKPTTTSNLLSNTDFSILIKGKPSQNHIIEDSGSGTKIVRLLLRYSLLTNEN